MMDAGNGPRVHVFGAGLAGLSTAVQLCERGVPVRVYEAAPQPGGRCRSFLDRVLGRQIDNGNHLLLSGNDRALAYIDAIGARSALTEPKAAAFPFVDLASSKRWQVRPNRGLVPWWLFHPDRRIPGLRARDLLAGFRLARATPSATVADVLDADSLLFERFWQPLVWAVMNTAPEHASACLLWAVLRETAAKGERYCRPLIAKTGLSDALVLPAVRLIERHGSEVRFGERLRALRLDADRASHLTIGREEVELPAKDQVVLAVPPSQLASLLPRLAVPDDEAVILNAHFRLDAAPTRTTPALIGLVNGTAHWVFVRGDIISVTISAAHYLGLADRSEEELLPAVWSDVRQALCLQAERYVAARLIRERRATFDQSPAGVARRPSADIGLRNLVLAGDFVDTGLPATIEGAIRSGERAAELVLQRLR